MTHPLKIVHCLRAPVGGLFRHVCDLARGQSALGHHVGIICDARIGDDLNEHTLEEITRYCALGVHRYKMHRAISVSDIATAQQIRSLCHTLGADIAHGHGAKGGAYARFAALGHALKVFYTPHGGSLHYSKSSPSGFVFLTLERLLGRLTDGLIFESRYGFDVYCRKVGTPLCKARVIHNGLCPAEFEPVPVRGDAAQFLYVGELRLLKGIDVFLQALSHVSKSRDVSAVIVGSGPDAEALGDLAHDLKLGSKVSFPGPMPARQAFALGHTLVVPSRAESFPYIVLEALAAAKPTLATNVGGIPEMFGAKASLLVEPDDATALAGAMQRSLDAPDHENEASRQLAQAVSNRFTVETMVTAINGFYHEILAGSGTAVTPLSASRSAAE